MPRQAHGRPVSHSGPSRPPKRKPAKGRGLNALEIAEQENPETTKIPKHRLGESYGDDDDGDTRSDAGERSSKRRKTETQDEEESESGSDPDGERWHVMDDDDEDSDIDSDDAFGESDEDRFADFTFRGSMDVLGKKNKSKQPAQKRGSRQANVVSDLEEESDIEDDFGDEGIDLATALDQASDNESEEDRKDTSKDRVRKDARLEVDSQSSSSEDESEDLDDMESTFSISDEEDGDHTRLQTFVEGLSAKKTDPKPRGDDSEAPNSKISAADLLQYVKDPRQRQSLKVLQNSEAKGPELYKGGIPGRLAAPLAKRQQDRLDRGAAYDQSKKELDKWVDTVKQNRRAEHISFPLPDPDGAPSSNKKLAPVVNSEPMNELESKIQDIMRESGILSAKGDAMEREEQEFEELEEQKLPLEEVQARRAELRKARDLMFREEIRAKRIKKIKSKAYRRVHRKERDKAAMQQRAELSAQGLVDSDAEREHNDRRRAEERMGARHRESKWAKGAKAAGRTIWDEDARVGVADMARRDDELRRRIEGKTAGSSDESEQSDSEGYSSDEAEEDIQQRLRAVNAPESGEVKSKLANMAFMQRAEASRKAANDAEVETLRRQMRSTDDHNGSDAETDDQSDVLPSGRQKFGGNSEAVVRPVPQQQLSKREFDERLSDEEEDLAELDGPLPTASAAGPPNAAKSKAQPILTAAKKQSRTAQDVETGPRIVSQIQYQKSRTSAPVNEGKSQKHRSKVLQLADQLSESENDDDDPFAEGDGQAETLADTIFMGPDDVSREFAKEKKATIAEEGDQEIDNGLPGWGSWGGAGINKKKQKQNKGRFVTKVKGVAPESRKDAKLDRVIINEKRIKKNGKYLATELPHPFESRQQYERALRLPLGPEWSTKSTFQDATKPRVLVKQGVIKPMARPMA
ncbi:uncharacterized protein HMPREF1541_07442 [Cyphellophora europaea CBS 101466]|uniref:Uncharacterized protein n=1 Tax=Cyphellophora europaea (strain CBS 101466) TaxID=1220924 RepID=W2RQ10_CYPE1|nr:uncharacterized protein HMPREF1541_07442 [Cyphellophora europaea CBS 101466]ETN37819.1 hypothetical protein HMPREF1541_07442 [Cyphellophora europaea CBS 101466]